MGKSKKTAYQKRPRPMRASFNKKTEGFAVQSSSQMAANQLDYMHKSNSVHARKLKHDFNKVAKGESRLGRIVAKYIQKRKYKLASAKLSPTDCGTIIESPLSIVINQSFLGDLMSQTTIVHEAIHLNQRSELERQGVDTTGLSLKSLQMMSLTEEAAAYAIENLFEDEALGDITHTNEMSEKDYKNYIEKRGRELYESFFKKRIFVDTYNQSTAHYMLELMAQGYVNDPIKKEFKVKHIRLMGQIDDAYNITRRAEVLKADQLFAGNRKMKQLFDIIEAIQTAEIRGKSSRAYRRRMRKIKADRNPFTGLLEIAPKDLLGLVNERHECYLKKADDQIADYMKRHKGDDVEDLMLKAYTSSYLDAMKSLSSEQLNKKARLKLKRV